MYDVTNEVQTSFQHPSPEAMRCRNQDLSGFFTSISSAQVQRAWMITRQFYRQHTIYTVDLKEQQQASRVFRGRRRQRATKQVCIHSEDIPTTIFGSLQLQVFAVAGRGFVQIHGSPVVVSAQAEIWRRTFSQSPSNINRGLLCLRYVDNRL